MMMMMMMMMVSMTVGIMLFIYNRRPCTSYPCREENSTTDVQEPNAGRNLTDDDDDVEDEGRRSIHCESKNKALQYCP